MSLIDTLNLRVSAAGRLIEIAMGRSDRQAACAQMQAMYGWIKARNALIRGAVPAEGEYYFMDAEVAC